MKIGDRIRNKRESAGISQTDLAIKIGVSKQTLYKYEKNVITNIPSDKIEEIAKALNVTESYLMGWEDNLTSEMADNVVDMLMDSKMSEYVKKLSLLNEEDREMIYSMIDRCSKK